MRMEKDRYYLGVAEAVSKRSTCLRAQCGVVLVNNDQIISTGYNGNARNTINCIDVGKCPREGYEPNKGRNLCKAVHGEMNSLISIARNGGTSCIGSTMYIFFKRLDDSRNSYDKPCDDCWKHIMNAGIGRIINYTEDKYHITLDETIIENGKFTTTDIKNR